MSNSSFVVEIKASKTLFILLGVLHALALFATFANTLPISVKLALSAVIGMHLWLQWRHYRLQTRPTVLMYADAMGWYQIINGTTVLLQIMPSSLITPFLIIVYYKKRSGKSSTSSLICFKDALSQSAFRQFLVQLKIT